jgi:pyruvate dehydrogenase E2 component (dihydrolipoamide acetyltransferase)
MSQPVTMPALSDTMGAGRLVKWTKHPGDKIKKGDVIAEVETDKAVMEVEAFQDGFLSGPLAAEGTEAPVGGIIGYIADNSNEISQAAVVQAPLAPSGDGRISAASAPATPAISAVLAASIVAPRPAAVRRVPAPREASPARAETPAREAARISSALSVLAAGPPYKLERASSLREAVARNMIAGATTPTFRVTAQLPFEPLLKTAQERRQSVSLLLARACALTIVAHPLFNAAYTPEGLARRDRVDIAIAVDGGDGLITPVLRDAAGRSMEALAHDWANLHQKVKVRRLLPADYSGATFYLSNLGSSSVVYAFDSIIPVGASAILSVAASRPEGAFCTLACDHRVVFGTDAARFLETLGHQLNDPAKLTAWEPQQ